MMPPVMPPKPPSIGGVGGGKKGPIEEITSIERIPTEEEFILQL